MYIAFLNGGWDAQNKDSSHQCNKPSKTTKLDHEIDVVFSKLELDTSKFSSVCMWGPNSVYIHIAQACFRDSRFWEHGAEEGNLTTLNTNRKILVVLKRQTSHCLPLALRLRWQPTTGHNHVLLNKYQSLVITKLVPQTQSCFPPMVQVRIKVASVVGSP